MGGKNKILDSYKPDQYANILVCLSPLYNKDWKWDVVYSFLSFSSSDAARPFLLKKKTKIEKDIS
jgi:hypothetical protein